MASPFRLFRKHQKVWFAVLGVMVMIAFVFMSGTGGSSSGTRRTDSVMVRTAKFGTLSRFQVEGLRSQRQQLLGFLSSLAMKAMQLGDRDGKIEQIRQVFGPATDPSVVEKWLFARQAEEMGIAVDEKAINDFLKDITNNRIPGAEIIKILHDQRSGMSEPQLFAILREELLALRLRALFHQITPPNQLNEFGLALPPGQRWDYFKRVSRYATVELAPVPVERFLKDVPEPSDADLKKFFETH